MEEWKKNSEDKAYREELIRFLPRPIQNDKELDRMTQDLLKLEDLIEENKASQAQIMLSELLAILIEKYEDEHYSIDHLKALSTPAERLADLMAEQGMTQRDLANLLNSRSLASEILSGKRSMSKAQIIRFAEYFKVPAETFTQNIMAPHAFVAPPKDEREALNALERHRKAWKKLGPNRYEIDGEVVSSRKMMEMAGLLPKSG